MKLAAFLAALAVCACTMQGLAPPASPSPLPTGKAGLEAFLPTAIQFVQEHRGLKFKTPPKVTFLADAEFVAELNRHDELDAAAYALEAKELHALGLLGAGVDLVRAERELRGGSVIGFYDSNTKQLYVRGVDPRASVRRVLVHELTHALQDQWFDINRSTSSNDESDLAYRTLVEGDAVRIQEEYESGLSPAEQAQIRQDDSSGPAPPADVPQVLEEIDSFPYIAGPPFTRAVVAQRGQSRLDAAFKDPPTTSAAVLHVGLFLAGTGPATVDEPAADGMATDHGVLGEFGLDLILEPLFNRGFSGAEARAVTAGWSGDRYVAWDQDGQTCLRDRLVMSGAAAYAALGKALDLYLNENPGVSVDGTGPVVLTACA